MCEKRIAFWGAMFVALKHFAGHHFMTCMMYIFASSVIVTLSSIFREIYFTEANGMTLRRVTDFVFGLKINLVRATNKFKSLLGRRTAGLAAKCFQGPDRERPPHQPAAES